MKSPLIRRTVAVAVMLCLINFAFTSVTHAQYIRNRNHKSSFYLGAEATMGTKTFSIKSDIPAIDGMKSMKEGLSLGVIGGGKLIMTKIKYGFFKPSAFLVEKIDLRNLELNVNAFPLEVFQTKNQFFKPYVVVGIDQSLLKFRGNYSLPTPPPPPTPELAQTSTDPCQCICPGDQEIIPVPGNTAVASSSPEEELSEDTVLGIVNVIRGSGGAGLIVHVPGKNTFINFFMEAQYGVPLSARAKSTAFDRTSVTGQLSLSAGLAIGLRR